MTNMEFRLSISRLTANVWRLSDDQKKLLFDKFEYLEDGRFEKLIDHIVDNFTKKDFDCSVKAFKNALKEISGESHNAESCNKCHSGWITYTKHSYSYVSRCDCPAGDELSRLIPRYRDLFPGEYYV